MKSPVRRSKAKSPRKSPKMKGGRRTAEERTRPKCDGETDIFTGEQIPEGQAIRLLSTLYNPPRYECFDVISLAQWFSTKKKYENPNTKAIFTDAQIAKIKKKLLKLKNAGIDVPELNMEGHYNHGGYDIPFEEEAVEIDEPETPIDELYDMYLQRSLNNRTPNFQSVKTFLDLHPELKECDRNFTLNIIHTYGQQQNTTVPELFIEFHDWRQLKDYMYENYCGLRYRNLKTCLLFNNSSLTPQDYKMTVAVILDNISTAVLHQFQLDLKNGTIMDDAPGHAVLPSNTFIMDAVNMSNISAYEKQKFKDILFPAVSGVKRTRAGVMYGGKSK